MTFGLRRRMWRESESMGRFFFFFFFDNLLVGEGEIWILLILIKKTSQCEMNFKTLDLWVIWKRLTIRQLWSNIAFISQKKKSTLALDTKYLDGSKILDERYWGYFLYMVALILFFFLTSFLLLHVQFKKEKKRKKKRRKKSRRMHDLISRC